MLWALASLFVIHLLPNVTKEVAVWCRMNSALTRRVIIIYRRKKIIENGSFRTRQYSRRPWSCYSRDVNREIVHILFGAA